MQKLREKKCSKGGVEPDSDTGGTNVRQECLLLSFIFISKIARIMTTETKEK